MTQVPSLPIVESFYSLQGEGFHAGTAAYFLRLAGCRNACPFCDTPQSWKEEGFARVPVPDLVRQVAGSGSPNCVVTGGEPMLHDLGPLCRALRAQGIACWLETSGSEPFSGQWDWICLSPKKGIPVFPDFYAEAGELKVVVSGEEDFSFAEAEAGKVRPGCRLYLQPEWDSASSVMPAIEAYILSHPRWGLSLQLHKFIGMR